ncbi:ABC transporter substrate-binding protein [Stakelama sp. CBK3Z-3]|uniref:ABC transporter substrate-binding protein n=1 Tax=Stakelama flava TaxID=2860338 RepID=A0ABS6XIE1_9SPHN|nr:ABC transporter substrate-binding protein [Stakelama flava]MBW4329957.1 ABC transporter substrate-binding protein [Stakelama flava]
MIRFPSHVVVAASLMLAVSGCDGKTDDSTILVSAIGGSANRADPDAGPLDFPDAVTMGATAQGLVRFDANGQVEPGLAQRWIVIEDGTSYIFRIADATWPDGSPVDARQVARTLTRALAPTSRNPLAPFLRSVDEVVAMTPQVVEVRLSRPRPDLLRLLAQPEMAVFRTQTLAGTGPLRTEGVGDPIRLHSAPEPVIGPDGDEDAAAPALRLRLRGERASLALIRYREHLSDLVIGGTFTDWPTARQSGVAQSELNIDPAAGLFGLQMRNRDGFLADADNRAAIAMALDRKALLDPIRDDWDAAETILPEQLDSASAPAVPGWASLNDADRAATARSRVSAWKARQKATMAPLRIALPDGPGANLLWTGIARALNAVGLSVLRVPLDARSDLKLVDAVAPLDSASWYLRTACQACSEEAVKALDAARTAPDAAARSLRLAEADSVLTEDGVFIPLARPLRWSLVSPRLDAFQRNSRAWHPLNHLRNQDGS